MLGALEVVCAAYCAL